MKKLFLDRVLDSSHWSAAKATWPIALVALLSWISIVACLDPAGSYPAMPEGPGLTVDEIFNVEQGVYLVEMSRSLGWLNLIPGTSQEAFRTENGYYNPDHPPLGRWWLGLHHHVAWWIAPPFEPDGFVVTACARTGSATAFALTVFMIGVFAANWSGRSVGIWSAVSLVLMPRVYGHAHLACLETMTNLTCTAAVLVVAHGWSGPRVPTWRGAMLAGILFGLALLTKIQAVLIPVPLILWAVWRWRIKAVVPLAVWGLTALCVFLAGWPYLWEAPFGRLLEYLGRTTNRATIYVWYFGARYPDKLVPWHYSFVIFGLTIPVILQGLGVLAIVRGLFDGPDRASQTVAGGKPSNPHSGSPSLAASASPMDPMEVARWRELLLGGCLLFPLIVFALPGIAVYDGERLFLTSFPLWALFIGRGWVIFRESLNRKIGSARIALAICTAALLAAASPLITASPCHLTYYNELVTVLMGGVDRTGLEVDYWGEGITRDLLRRTSNVVPRGEVIGVVPTLHQFQPADYVRQSPILRSHENHVVEYEPNSPSPRFILVYRRLADLPQELDDMRGLKDWTILEKRHGAYLARRNERRPPDDAGSK